MHQENTLPETSQTADFFTRYINRSQLTQNEIALACGLKRQNIISMFKTGATKVPIERIPALSRTLKIDPRAFLSIAMEEYYPKMWDAIQEILGQGVSVTEDEMHILKTLRDRSGTGRVKIVTQAQRDALRALADSLGGVDPNRQSS